MTTGHFMTDVEINAYVDRIGVYSPEANELIGAGQNGGGAGDRAWRRRELQAVLRKRGLRALGYGG